MRSRFATRSLRSAGSRISCLIETAVRFTGQSNGGKHRGPPFGGHRAYPAKQVGVRQLHTASATFVDDASAIWRPWFARSLPTTRLVIGHGDLGPWNILATNDLAVAFIDWDNAGPVDACWELAQIVWLNAQLHDDDVAAMNGLPPAAQRAHQARLILDAYGLDSADRVGFVDRMIEFAIRSTREEAVNCNVGSSSPSPANDGFPVLWAITWRARSAAWMLDHRRLLEAAIVV